LAASAKSGISIYYADTEGVFPFDVGVALTSGGRYLNEMPLVQIPNYTGHAANRLVGTACSEWDCTDILMQLAKEAHGVYQSPDYFSKD
jgi:hypothetical protein